MSKLKLKSLVDSVVAEKILDNTNKSLAFIPNMYNNMAHSPALLDMYTYAYDSFRSNSGFSSIEQEVVFLSIAYENNCEYCMAAHSFVADNMSMVPEEITHLIRVGGTIPYFRLNELSMLSRLLTKNRGHATQNEINNFLSAGYNESHVLDIIAAIGVKTMSNYSNHLTDPEVDSAFEGRKWSK